MSSQEQDESGPNRVLNILLVEDEAIIALDVAGQLLDAGFKVSGICVDGETAIRSVLATPPDLILMDVQIKGPIDGVETMLRIREKSAVPVIFVSAFGDQATMQRIGSVGAQGYLPKPFFHDDLIRAIRAICSGRVQGDAV